MSRLTYRFLLRLLPESFRSAHAAEMENLFAEALEDRNARVRVAALRGLYKMDPERAKPHFLEALADPNAEPGESKQAQPSGGEGNPMGGFGGGGGGGAGGGGRGGGGRR